MAEKKIQKRTIESREKLLSAGRKLFCDKGYFNTNTKEIAAMAGVSVGNFYNYYKDKSDIYYELAVRYVEGSAKAITDLENILLVAEDKRAIIKTYISTQMERANATGRFFSDCQVLIQDNEKLKTLFEEDTEVVIKNIEDILQKIPGVIKRASYYAMARLLFNMIDKLSSDACTITDKELYLEYQVQLIEIVQNYLFGEK